jgi:hypothetical protein
MEIIMRCATKLEAVNNANKFEYDIAKYCNIILKPYIGKKILKKDNTFLKKINDLIQAEIVKHGIHAWVSNGIYSQYLEVSIAYDTINGRSGSYNFNVHLCLTNEEGILELITEASEPKIIKQETIDAGNAFIKDINDQMQALQVKRTKYILDNNLTTFF